MNGGMDTGVEKKENNLRMHDRLDTAAANARTSARESSAPDHGGQQLPRLWAHHPVRSGHATIKRSLSFAGAEWSRTLPPLALSTGSGTGSGFGARRGGRGGSFPPGGGLPPTGGDPDRPERPSRGTPPSSPTNFQPEERYWTDYLRIALPVVGLLLMLGLFLFWAGELIGDEAEPTDTPDVALVQETNVPPTETPTAEADVTLQASSAPAGTAETPQPTRAGAAAPPEPTATATSETEPTNTPSTTDEPTAEEETANELAIGSEAVVTEDAVNLRADPTTESAALTVLSVDSTVTILDGPTEAEGYTWWYIETEDGTTGWVAGDFLSPA